MSAAKFLGVLALLIVTPGIARSQAGPARVLDSLMTTLRGDSTPATGVAVVYRGKVVYERVTGWSDLGQHIPAGINTRFNWASIAKQFTAFGISRLVERGELDIDVAASKYLPELAQVNDEITLNALLHHTSGLEDSDGLLALSGFSPADPLTREQIADVMLRQRHLRFRPGTAHSYSNGGYVLLAEVIARHSGRRFSEWMHDQVFEPLGLTHTGISAFPDEVVPDEARAYLRSNTGMQLDLYVDSPGAGALRASIGDMARWATHVMQPTWERSATLRLRERGVLRNAGSIDYAWGLGWNTYRGVQALTHGGSTPAVDAFIVMIPEHNFAVVAVSAGQVTPNPGTLAYRAVDAWLADKLQPLVERTGPRMMMITDDMMRERPSESEGVRAPQETVRAAPGRYRMADGTLEVVRLNSESGRLEVARNGVGPWWPLNPLPDGRFITMPLRIAYTFEGNPVGGVRGIIREASPLRPQTNEKATKGEREAEKSFTVATSAPYVGWYYSAETLAWFEVVLDGTRLALRHARLGMIPMAESEEHRFVMESPSIVGAQFTMGQGGMAEGVVLQARSWGVEVAFQRMEMSAKLPGNGRP